MKIKTTLTTLCCAVLACTAFSSANAATIGVSMPTQSLQRWNQDGHNLEARPVLLCPGLRAPGVRPK